MKLNEAIEKINNLIAEESRFKIGKTWLTKEEVFKTNYIGKYDRIEKICSSDCKMPVDIFEGQLIEFYREHAKCDNDKASSEVLQESGKYMVYIVIRS